jgi:hypothetical protein
MQMQRDHKKVFMWLCVTNKGAAEVNQAAVKTLGITTQDLLTGCASDPKVDGEFMCIRKGMMVRLTRNLDKERGFVNGALGLVVDILQANRIFTVRVSTGSMLLVHPIVQGDRLFLPCTYGYATTIRRAQGATLDMGCVYFNHSYPPERGYGYVAVSRFKTKDGVFHFGPLRRTDWLPVGAGNDAEQTTREVDSMSDNSDDEMARERDEETSDEDSDADSMDKGMFNAQRQQIPNASYAASDSEEENMFGLQQTGDGKNDLAGL